MPNDDIQKDKEENNAVATKRTYSSLTEIQNVSSTKDPTTAKKKGMGRDQKVRKRRERPRRKIKVGVSQSYFSTKETSRLRCVPLKERKTTREKGGKRSREEQKAATRKDENSKHRKEGDQQEYVRERERERERF